MKRLNVHIHENTYKQLDEFINENRLITTKLSKGTIVTVALNILYETIKEKDIDTVINEYLNRESGL